MTVCIAAMADVGQSIVLACDRMISTGSFSGDRIAFKLYPLGTNEKLWYAMMAGDDLTHISPVIEEANSRLINLRADDVTADSVGKAFAGAYQAVRLKYAEGLILSPLGISIEEFRKDGQKILGDTFREVAADMTRVDLGCEFLLAGFDWGGFAHILTIENPGIPKNHDPIGFYAIGSGALNAQSIMYYHSVSAELPLPRMLYHVCEAKFMAESAFGVGRHSTVQVMTHDSQLGDALEIAEEGIESIRRAWEELGRPRVPEKAIGKMGAELEKLPAMIRRKG